MSNNLKKAAREAVIKSTSLVSSKPLVSCSKPLKKAPIKREMMDQSTACGMVAVGAAHIPPANRNKKSKL